MSGRMKMTINELALEYENQYNILRRKIKMLRASLKEYSGADLELLHKKIKIYYDMAFECKSTYILLSGYYNTEDE